MDSQAATHDDVRRDRDASNSARAFQAKMRIVAASQVIQLGCDGVPKRTRRELQPSESGDMASFLFVEKYKAELQPKWSKQAVENVLVGTMSRMDGS